MRFVSWNINSVRLRLNALKRVADELSPDFMCLQEIKSETTDFPSDAIAEIGFPHQIVRGMKGYNGVAILARTPIAGGDTRDWCGRHDCRHIAANIGSDVELHNFYVPAGGDEPDPNINDKFAHKLKFLKEAETWSRDITPNAKRVLVGDLNIAPHENDVWSHKQLLNVVSHTPLEVEALSDWQTAHGWIDAIRTIIPETEKIYSWWSYRNRTWPGSDRGRRLDHIWVSPALAESVKNAGILRDARGWEKPSDHAPVWADVDL